LKKIIWALIILTMAALCSCSPARKLAPQQNRTILVPEVSRVTFDSLDLKTAPKVIRDVAKVMENQDASVWARTGNTTYLVLSQGDKTNNYDLAVDEILQRIPEQGFTCTKKDHSPGPAQMTLLPWSVSNWPSLRTGWASK